MTREDVSVKNDVSSPTRSGLQGSDQVSGAALIDG